MDKPDVAMTMTDMITTQAEPDRSMATRVQTDSEPPMQTNPAAPAKRLSMEGPPTSAPLLSTAHAFLYFRPISHKS
jgi:hypothetical protein